MSHTERAMPELNSGSMADIAFLLLTFYMMTTVIEDNKGLTLLLPPYLNKPIDKPVSSRNLFTIHINSHDQFMIEGENVETISGLRKEIKEFILNNGKSVDLSDNPEDAVVSIKTDRGTSYRSFLEALDEAQAAYYEIYASRAEITPAQFRQLDLKNPTAKNIYEKAKKGFPMNISIAEPTTASK